MAIPKPTYLLALAIASSIAAIAVFGVITYQNTTAVRESERLVARAFSIREETGQILSAFQDMQSGERGYIITGDLAYLEPYHIGLDQAFNEHTHLRTLTADNQTQQDRLDRIQELFEQLVAQHRMTITLRTENPVPEGFDKVRKIVLLGEGKRLMDEVRAIVKLIIEDTSRQRV
jgi:two-component system, cell cycle sensor histidine kinase and response regulator CckA